MSNLTIVGDFAVTGDIEADTVFGRNFDDFVSDAVNLTGNVTITGSELHLKFVCLFICWGVGVFATGHYNILQFLCFVP